MRATECIPGKRIRSMRCASATASTTRTATLHGALLDAELLAEVYLRMTRGQDSLVIDAVDLLDGASGAAAIDLRRSTWS